jgi:hypothetical protein
VSNLRIRQDRVTAKGESSAAEIDEVNVRRGLAEEAGAEALELLDRVSGVEDRWKRRDVSFEIRGDAEISRYGLSSGLGGVNDGERVVEGGQGATDGRLEQGVVGAAEEEGGCTGGLGEGFGEVDSEDLVGDGVVDPAFFDEGDEEGAGFFEGLEVEGVEGAGVRVGLDGGGGGEDQDLSRRSEMQVLRLRSASLRMTICFMG